MTRIARALAVTSILLLGVGAARADPPPDPQAKQGADRAAGGGAMIAAGSLLMAGGVTSVLVGEVGHAVHTLPCTADAASCNSGYSTGETVAMIAGAGAFLFGGGLLSWGIHEVHEGRKEMRGRRVSIKTDLSLNGAKLIVDVRF